MTDDRKGVSPPPERRHSIAMIGVGLIVLAAAVALALYAWVAKSTSQPSIPNPQTVTCSQFAGLTSAQQNRIAHELGKADGVRLDASMISDGWCGINAGPNDPVSGATSLGG